MVEGDFGDGSEGFLVEVVWEAVAEGGKIGIFIKILKKLNVVAG